VQGDECRVSLRQVSIFRVTLSVTCDEFRVGLGLVSGFRPSVTGCGERPLITINLLKRL